MLVLAGVLVANSAFAQYVENVSFFQGMDSTKRAKTFIVFDLTASTPTIASEIKVKLFRDDVGVYLKHLTGDVGPLVYPGKRKTIAWDHNEELVHYSGEINLSIEAVPSVKVPTKIKKGKQMTVQLADIYTPNKSYAIKLYRSGVELTRLNDVLLIENKFPLLIPRKSKVKKNYQIAITDGEKTFFSNPFKIKPRLSAKWIIVPLLAAPAYWYIQKTIDENSTLPGPPPN